jgi:hypothetical protein
MIDYFRKAERRLYKAIRDKDVNSYNVARDSITSMLKRPKLRLTSDQITYYKSLLELKI